MRGRGIGMVLAAVLVLAGCGSSSSSHSVASTGNSSATSTSTPTPASAGQQVTARGGGFTTIVPTAFTDATTRATTLAQNLQYAAAGPRVNGFTTNINVIRGAVPGGVDIGALTRQELVLLRRQLPNAHRFSAISQATVDGVPARALGYLAAPRGHVVLHIRQVFVLKGSFAYTITYTAIPSAYAASLGALTQVLNGWHWR